MKILRRNKKILNRQATGWIDTKLSEVKANIQELVDVADENKVSDVDINAIREQIKEIHDFIGSKDSPSVDYTDIITKLNDLSLMLDDLEGKVFEAINFQFYGEVDGGLVIEGEWTPIQWEQQKNSFVNMTYVSPTFTTTETIDFLKVNLTGQANNTGVSKIISIRLVNSLGEVIGAKQDLEVTTSGLVIFNTLLQDLPAGSYIVEITSTVGGGNITFTGGKIQLEKSGGGADLLNTKVNGLGTNKEVIDFDETVFIPVSGKITIDPEQLGGKTDKIELADPLTEAPSGVETTQQEVNRTLKLIYNQLEID